MDRYELVTSLYMPLSVSWDLSFPLQKPGSVAKSGERTEVYSRLSVFV